jgi:hypothetical protein
MAKRTRTISTTVVKDPIEEFIANLPTDPIDGAIRIHNRFVEMDRRLSQEQELIHYDAYLDSFILITTYCDAKRLPFKTPPPITDDARHTIDNIKDYFQYLGKELDTQQTRTITEQRRTKYALLFSQGFHYEFSEGDLQRVQQLINELRTRITASKLFDEGHRVRVLQRLEKLQSELHQKMADLDKFWGLVGDAGIVLGKLGKDAKPFVDRIREIADIIWRTQTRSEALPSSAPFPQLEKPSDNE